MLSDYSKIDRPTQAMKVGQIVRWKGRPPRGRKIAYYVKQLFVDHSVRFLK